jgi:hypothetical protein
MADATEVPAGVLEQLRAICLSLPATAEESAWAGIRWVVAGKTFAHVVVVADGWPPAYARAAGTDGPAAVLTFRLAGTERDVLRAAGPPWFGPPWHPDAVGLVLGPAAREGADAAEGVGWDEVAELLTDSHRLRAPRSLGLRGPDLA